MSVVSIPGLYNPVSGNFSPLLATDLLPGWRASLPTSQQNIQIPVQAIIDLAQGTINLSLLSIQNTLNTLTASNAGKQDVSEKDQANGYVGLRGDGTIDPTQYQNTGLVPKGDWNATTNSPAIADNTGLIGYWYVVTAGTGTTRNLGSGNITFGDNDWVIHDGAKYVKNGNGTPIAITINGVTAATFTLTTAGIPDASGYRYVTDDMLAALVGTTGIPSASNKFVTNSDPRLTGTGITVGRQFFSISDQEDGVNICGLATNRTLQSLGYTNQTASARWSLTAADWGGTITAATTQYDDVVVAESFLKMGIGQGRDLVSDSNKSYYLTRPAGYITIPSVDTSNGSSTRRSLMMSFNGQSCLFRDYSGIAGHTFKKKPANQTELETWRALRWDFEKFQLEGSAVSGQIGMEFCGTRNSTFTNIIFKNYDYGFVARACLRAAMKNCEGLGNTTCAIYSGIGDWTGATSANSIGQFTFYNCDIAIPGILARGFWLVGQDSVSFYNCETEGSRGEYGVFIDCAGNFAHSYMFFNFRVEQWYDKAWLGVVASDSRCIHIIGGDFEMKHAQYGTTALVEMDNISGNNPIYIDKVLGNSSPNQWIFINKENGGSGVWEFDKSHIQGNPSNATELRQTASFPLIWAGYLTSGTLTIGHTYLIDERLGADDFTNVGAASNTTGTIFVASGTTPTLWTSGSSLHDEANVIRKPDSTKVSIIARKGT